MENIQCKYGPELAKFYCSCQQPNVYFCQDHHKTHKKEFGYHVFRVCSIKPNSTTKLQLSNKINEVKKEAEFMKNVVQEECNNFYIAIGDYEKKAIDKLNEFINICDQVLQEIELILSIPNKLIYSPLQSILLSENAYSIIHKISAPYLKKLPSTMDLFSYSPSTFPHILYNFSDFDLGFFNGKIELYPKQHPINCKKIISNSSRFINIGNKRFLFTGGKDPRGQATDECFVLKADTLQIRAIPPINNPRSSHTMAWIEGNPAVIGGREGSRVLQSVEIFRDNSWLVADPIKVARRSLTSVCSNKCAWILGGHDHNNTLLDTIESNQSGDWVILSLKLPKPSCSIGLSCLENSLLLIGGKTTGKNISNETYLIDICTLKIVKLDFLASWIYIPRGQFVVEARLMDWAITTSI